MLNIKVVGSGCATCSKLEQLCREVVTEQNIPAEIETAYTALLKNLSGKILVS